MQYHLKQAQPEQVKAKLDALPGQGGKAARWLAGVARANIPAYTDGFYHTMPTFAIATGAIVCHVSGFTKHANLGFGHGTQLLDPAGSLAGSRKGHRYVRVTAHDAAFEAKLIQLIRQAVALAQANNGQ